MTWMQHPEQQLILQMNAVLAILCRLCGTSFLIPDQHGLTDAAQAQKSGRVLVFCFVFCFFAFFSNNLLVTKAPTDKHLSCKQSFYKNQDLVSNLSCHCLHCYSWCVLWPWCKSGGTVWFILHSQVHHAEQYCSPKSHGLFEDWSPNAFFL